jgi:hypothetical protein
MSITSRQLALLLTVLCTVTLLILAFTTLSGLHDGDSMTHYFMSRYSWKYPDKLLDLWGKPMFTLLSSPFSQFGFSGMKVFNILCAVLASYLAYRLAEWLGLRLAPLVIVYCIFMPVYIMNIPSGLTEILFSFALISCIFLAAKNQAAAAALLASFLPFMRQEGFMMLPLFTLFFLADNKYFPILLLATGTLIYSLIGYFMFDDFFWIFNNNPYGRGGNLYGHGELDHFVKNSRSITGIPLNILYVIGLLFGIYLCWKWIKSRLTDRKAAVEILLIYGPAVTMLVAHSIFWWKGIYGSLGMLRVMAAVVPCMAIIALRGTELVLTPFFRLGKLLYFAVALAFGYLVIVHRIIPFIAETKMGDDKKLLAESAQWVKENGYKDRRVFFSHPLTPFFLDVDPWDSKVSGELNGVDTANVSGGIAPGNIVIWESLLGPREVGIPADSISNPKYFDVKKTYHAGEASAGGYQIIISERKRN